jgi:ornithine cyclodeaminase/alanine dehydrogenase-like protein (mu-crystallin family)
MTDQTDRSPRLPYLSEKLLEGFSITTQQIVEGIEQAFAGQRRGSAWTAPKAVITPGDDRYIMATLAVSDDPPVVATKSLVLNPRNPKRGLAAINSIVTLLDSETGLPLAVIDGNWVTAWRTAGLSAVAAKRLARRDAAVMAFIGCGVQAQSHLAIFQDLFPLREIHAFGRGTANRDALCRAAEARGLTAVRSKTAKEAIGDADIVVSSVTLLPSPEPFLDAQWLKSGCLAVMTDMAAPWFADSLSAFQRIVIDDLEQETKMSKPMVDPSLVAGDLFGLLGGDLPGRENQQQRIAFIFRGLALGDLALAGLAWRHAKATGAIPS